MSQDRLAGLLAAALLFVLLGAWQLVADLDLVSGRLLPSPTEVVAAFVALLQRSYFWDELWGTLSVIVGGFIGTAAIGFLLAIGLSMFEFVRRALYPVVVAGDVIPKITLIPVIIVTFGFGQTSRFIIVVISAFFPVFISSLTALTSADQAGDDLLRSMGASRAQRFRYHRIPQGLPGIFAGLKISLTVSFIVGVVAELLIRNEGLGYLINQFREQLQIDFVFAVTVTIGALGVLLFFLMEWLERRVVFWSDTRTLGSDRVPL